MSGYITHLNDNCSANAIKEIDGVIIDESIITLSLAITRYCNEILKEKSCDDLNCFLLYEIIKYHFKKQITMIRIVF